MERFRDETQAIKLAVARRFEASADVVWSYLNWRGLEKLAGGIFQRVDYVEGYRSGESARRIHMSEGPPIVERLFDIDEAGRSYRYQVIDEGALPITDYLGYVRVAPCGDGACHAKIESRATPVSTTSEDWRQMWLSMERSVFDQIAEKIAG